MISNLKLKAWMILLLFIFVVGILYLVGTNADEFTEAIKTPPVTDAQLATTVADYNKAQIAQIESLKSETHELKVELAAVKSEVFLQSKRMEELTNNIRAVRTELEIVKTQRTVAPKPEAKINPATHPMVAAQLQNKKPAPGTLDTEIAKNLGKGRTASELTPDEQKKLSKLKKNALMEKLASRKVAPETKPTPNAGLMKKLKGQPKALPSKSFSDSLQTLKKVLQNKEIKRPGK